MSYGSGVSEFGSRRHRHWLLLTVVQLAFAAFMVAHDEFAGDGGDREKKMVQEQESEIRSAPQRVWLGKSAEFACEARSYNSKQESRISFTAKVRATGQLFLAGGQTGEDGILRDAHLPMRQGVKYSGNLLDAVPGSSPWIEYSEVEWAVFGADELEEFDANLRLVRF